jgi:hypothetical protein
MTEAEKMAERLEKRADLGDFGRKPDLRQLDRQAAALIRRLSGRLCVNCGRTFPASHDRAKAPEDCPSQDACTIDMTLEEAFNHWRQKAHDDRAENEALRVKQSVLVESLQPFTTLETDLCSTHADDEQIEVFEGVTAGHIRRARAALSRVNELSDTIERL